MKDGERKMADIKEKVRQGEYRVDPRAVADAFLRRLDDLAAARATYPVPNLLTGPALTWSARSRSAPQAHL